ncbi:MAG: hypothetical protein K6D59_07070 [Bacteroidales bacterium]|nr:hypothetical protein [Bacteroidales bacterium]
MKRYTLLLVFLSLTFALSAQNDSKDKEEYTHQYNKLYKSYLKEPTNVATMLEMALFYSDTLNPMLDYPTAMNYITAAETRYIEVLEDREKYKEASRLIKKKITIVLVRQTKHRIASQARRHLDNTSYPSDATLDNYAQAFKNDPVTLQLVESKRMQTKYYAAKQANTLESYHTFLNSYPTTLEGEDAAKNMALLAEKRIAHATRESQVDSLLAGHLDVDQVRHVATNRKSAIAYKKLMENPSPKGYRDFLSRYPGSDQHAKVQELIDGLLQQEFNELTSPRQLADFANDNPESPLAEQAIEKLKKLITERRDMEAVSIYLDEFKLDVSYNDIYLKYFNWHTEEGNKAPVEQFSKLNPDFPYKMAVDDALKAAEKFDSINIMMPFDEKDFKQWASKIYHLTGKKESFVALQRTLQGIIASKQWNKVPERLEFFTLSFEDNCVEEVAELRQILEKPIDKQLTLTTVVRPPYDFMHPVMHSNGKLIYFNRIVGGISHIQAAHRTVTKKNVVWRSSGDIHFTNIDNSGIEIYSLYDNDSHMLLGHNGDIMVAQASDSGWTVTETLPYPVNSPYRDYDAFMVPDGSGILIASDRPGGQNLQPSGSYFHGDTALASDLYFIPRTDKGWGKKAINLGFDVNSPYMECSPVVSNDLKTLYFITDGRGGLGYGDIYYTTRDNTSDWSHWAKPVNYGKEVNSGKNEISLTISNDDATLTLCSDVGGHYGCYNVPAYHLLNSSMAKVTVSPGEIGIVFDIVELENQRSINHNQSIKRQEEWSTSLYSDKHYIIYPRCEGLYLPAIAFTPGNQHIITPKAYTPNMLTQLSKNSQSLNNDGIVFENNHANLLSVSMIEIDNLAQFLKNNASLSLEIIVHVDGNDDTFCYNLSQSRGDEIKKQLILRGVNSDNITVSPYGNSNTKNGGISSSINLMFR